jgi:phage-related protein
VEAAAEAATKAEEYYIIFSYSPDKYCYFVRTEALSEEDASWGELHFVLFLCCYPFAKPLI